MNQEYYNIFMTKMFETFGQLAATLVTTTVALPMYSYYYNRQQRLLAQTRLTELFCSENEGDSDSYEESDEEEQEEQLHETVDKETQM